MRTTRVSWVAVTTLLVSCSDAVRSDPPPAETPWNQSVLYPGEELTIFDSGGDEEDGFGVLVHNPDGVGPVSVTLSWKDGEAVELRLLEGEWLDSREVRAEAAVMTITVLAPDGHGPIRYATLRRR